PLFRAARPLQLLGPSPPRGPHSAGAWRGPSHRRPLRGRASCSSEACEPRSTSGSWASLSSRSRTSAPPLRGRRGPRRPSPLRRGWERRETGEGSPEDGESAKGRCRGRCWSPRCARAHAPAAPAPAALPLHRADTGLARDVKPAARLWKKREAGIDYGKRAAWDKPSWHSKVINAETQNVVKPWIRRAQGADQKERGARQDTARAGGPWAALRSAPSLGGSTP
ncbi:unnamed protein product, partial [Prorocentrum cordatum]